MTDWTRLCADAACVMAQLVEIGDETYVRVWDSEAPKRTILVPAASWEALLAAVRAPLEARIRELEEEVDSMCSNEVIAAYLESKESYE